MTDLAMAIVGLLFGLLALLISVVQLCRRRPYAPVLLVISLPGLLGCAYHTWRLWP